MIESNWIAVLVIVCMLSTKINAQFTITKNKIIHKVIGNATILSDYDISEDFDIATDDTFYGGTFGNTLDDCSAKCRADPDCVTFFFHDSDADFPIACLLINSYIEPQVYFPYRLGSVGVVQERVPSVFDRDRYELANSIIYTSTGIRPTYDMLIYSDVDRENEIKTFDGLLRKIDGKHLFTYAGTFNNTIEGCYKKCYENANCITYTFFERYLSYQEGALCQVNKGYVELKNFFYYQRSSIGIIRSRLPPAEISAMFNF